MLEKKGSILRELVYCLDCKQYTSHKIAALALIETKTIENIENNLLSEEDNSSTIIKQYSKVKSISQIQNYSQIIYCVYCKLSSLRNIEINKISEVPDKVEIIPKRPKIENKFKEVLPIEVFTLYEEVLFDYENSFKFSCGASIRSLIELICKNRKHKNAVIEDLIPEFLLEEEKKQRFQEIKKMYLVEFNNIGIIPRLADSLSIDEKKKLEIKAGLSKQVKKLKNEIKTKRPNSSNDFDILENVVEWGNENIHDFKVPTQQELKDVITIVDFLLHALYLDEHEESKFKNSRTSFNNRR